MENTEASERRPAGRWIALIGLGALMIAAMVVGNTGGGRQPEPEIKAQALYSGLLITSADPRDFTECEWTLNDDYVARGDWYVGQGETEVPWGAFVKSSGERFAFPRLAPTSLVIDCDGPNRTYQYFTW